MNNLPPNTTGLNSTQVMFAATQPVFIDKAAAKAALEPGTAAILAYPDHSILIAVTTATAGTQESCVGLSNRRTDAVKDLLVNSFSVPESQLKSIGLGHEADPFVWGQGRDANGNFVETGGTKTGVSGALRPMRLSYCKMWTSSVLGSPRGSEASLGQ